MQLSDHFTFRHLLRYTFPSVVMMIFTSVYGVVDGFFVSNFVGKTPFAAVNFIMPLLMMMGSVGFMFGTGGSTLISKTLGEGNPRRANEIFSMVVVFSVLCGALLTGVGFLLLRPVAVAMGAQGQLLTDSLAYGRVILAALPFFILQYEFQCLFVTAGKPHLGLFTTVAAGLTNMVLDALLVAVFPLGLFGAALATSLSQFIGGVVPLLYFARQNGSLLRFCRFRFDGRALLKTAGNGSSEFMSNVSSSLVSMLYNVQLMKYAGEDGVAAYGVLMYICFVFLSVFIGYSVGSAPIVGYHYGAGHRAELKSLLRRGLVLISAGALLMFAAGEGLAVPFSRLFVGYDAALLEMTVRAFRIFSFSFLFSGFSIFGSAFFTALNDGLTSALVSFLRTLVFQVISVLLLPVFFKLNGIWFSLIVAEVLSCAATAFFLLLKREKYGY